MTFQREVQPHLFQGVIAGKQDEAWIETEFGNLELNEMKVWRDLQSRCRTTAFHYNGIPAHVLRPNFK